MANTDNQDPKLQNNGKQPTGAIRGIGQDGYQPKPSARSQSKPVPAPPKNP